MITENPKSLAHLQNIMKHSAQFQVNWIQDMTRSESARAVSPSQNAKTKIQKPHAAYIHIHKNVIYQNFNQCDDRYRTACGDKIGRRE